MHTLIKSLNLFSAFIEGTETDSTLQNHLKFYKTHPLTFNRDFHSITADCNETVTHALKQLLIKLNIAQDEWDKYFGLNLTIYEFLIKLDKERYIQTTYIIKSIKKQRHYTWLLLVIFFILLSLLITTLFVICLPYITVCLPIIIKAIIDFKYTQVLFGISCTIVTSAESLYTTQFNHKKTQEKRQRNYIFLALNLFFTGIGYSILLISQCTLVNVASVFFILATATHLVRELFNLKMELNRQKQLPETEDKLQRELVAIRNDYRSKIYRNKAIIKTVVALAILSLFVGMQIFPGNIVIVCVLFSVILAQKLSLMLNKRYARKHLQNELREVHAKYKTKASELTPLPQSFSLVSNQEILPYRSSLNFFTATHPQTNDTKENLCYVHSFNEDNIFKG